MRAKITSMKRAFILFWHGLTVLLTGIANWFTVILGMKDNSKYGKIIPKEKNYDDDGTLQSE